MNHLLIFAELYPNLYSVSINEDPRNQQIPSVQQDRIVQFLEHCNSLVKMSFFHSRLTDYAQLLSIPACRSVMRILIIENHHFPHTLNFDFLANFPFLIEFATNAANRTMMFNLMTLFTPLFRPCLKFFFFFGPLEKVVFFLKHPVQLDFWYLATVADASNFNILENWPQLNMASMSLHQIPLVLSSQRITLSHWLD